MAMDGMHVLILVPTGEPPEYVPVAEQTGLSTENSHNMIDVSSKDSSHTKWLPGKEDDTMSLEALYVPDDAAMQALIEAKKNRETVVVRRSENGTEVQEAEAWVTTISNDYPDNDNSTVSVEFQLNEAWREVSA